MKYLMTDEIRNLGILQELNREFFHPLGLAAEVDLEAGTLKIQDFRDDPEGMIFGDGVMEWEKCKRFTAFRLERYERRCRALGFVHQAPAFTLESE